MKNDLDLKAYRPSFVNELSDADMQKYMRPVSNYCVFLSTSSRIMGSDNIAGDHPPITTILASVTVILPL
jgi:hypothetical protein